MAWFFIGTFVGIVSFALVTTYEEKNFSKKYHLYLNCTGGNIKLLVPTREITTFEKVLKGTSTVTNLEIVIKDQKYPMAPSLP